MVLSGEVMSESKKSVAARALDIPVRAKPSVYPQRFAVLMEGREKRPIGDFFGIRNFGVNLTRLAPGAQSSLFHKHSKQDEFIFILEGEATLITENEETVLEPGMCAGFPAGGTAHQLLNRSKRDVLYIEVGDRTPGDEGTYPNEDLKAAQDKNGQWVFTKKDGTPY